MTDMDWKIGFIGNFLAQLESIMKQLTINVCNMFLTSVQISDNSLSPNTFVITSFQLLSRIPGENPLKSVFVILLKHSREQGIAILDRPFVSFTEATSFVLESNCRGIYEVILGFYVSLQPYTVQLYIEPRPEISGTWVLFGII
jgi:hypothetical protein